jgi:phosphatidylglycerol:prolipoprotein diacylglycerol transferase
MSYPYVTDAVNALFGTSLHVPIPMFGTIVVIAVVAATMLVRREVERREMLGRLPRSTSPVVADLPFVSVISGFVGARVFHIIDHWSQFVADPASMIFARAGYSIFGGLCFGVIAGLIFLKRRSIPIRPMLDAAAPAMMLGYAIGRLGCQIAGDGDWGIAANMALKPAWLPDWLWAQTYEGNIVGVVIPAPGVYPTPIYESIVALAVFAVLWMLRAHSHRPGFLFSLYLLLAGFERLLIEKIRINVEHALFGDVSLTQAEVISVLLIVAGLVGVLVTLRTRHVWARIAFSIGVLSALSACAPFSP